MDGQGEDALRNTSTSKRGRWSTGFLVVGSALLGATAVAFWNRGTIARLRKYLPSEAEYGSLPASRPVKHDEDIF